MSPLLSLRLIFGPLTHQFPCSRMPSLSCPPMREPYVTFRSQRSSTCPLKPNFQNLALASALRCAFHPGSSFAFHGRLTIHGIPISDILHSASAPHFQSTPKNCPLRHSDITATSCVPSRCQASLLTPSPAPGSYADQPVS